MKKKSVKKASEYYVNIFNFGNDDCWTSGAWFSAEESFENSKDMTDKVCKTYSFTIKFTDKKASIVDLRPKKKVAKKVKHITAKPTKKLPSKTLKKQVKTVVAKKGKVKSKK